jgi:hypothetical protein
MDFTQNQLERFWAKVNIKSVDECWVWVAATRKGGYGIFRPTGKTFISSHRMSYIIANGEIPKNSVICHSCNNPSCVNPRHLYSGTQFDNMRQAAREGRFEFRFMKRLNKQHSKDTEINGDI